MRLPTVLFTVLTAAFIFLPGSSLAATGFEPPPDEYDWIQLTSDEWLKGELISLYDDDLQFESDNLGVLSLDWEDVRVFRGHETHRVSLAGSEPVTGKLRVDGDRILVTVDGQAKETHRGELVSITPPAFREFDNWSGDIALGFNSRGGNTETTEYNLLAGLERRTPGSRLSFDYLGNYNETEGEEVANNHRLNGSWDLFSGSAFFWRPLFGQYFRDRFQNIEHQVTIETGVGYEIINNSRTEWTVSGGVGVNYVSYRSVSEGEDESNRSPAVSIGTDFETELTDWLDYLLSFHMTFLDEDSGEIQHHLLTTLSTDLYRNWDLDVSFVWDRIQKPQERADGTIPEQDDYWLMIGLGYEF